MSDVRVGDLTVEELRALIRQTVRDLISEYFSEGEGESGSDQELALRPAIAAELREFLATRPTGKPLDHVARDMGLDSLDK